MSSPEVKGFTVSPARAAFVLSLIAIATFGWKIPAYFVTLDTRVQSHADYIVEDKENTKQVLGELKSLNQKVDRLTFVIEGTGTKHTLLVPGPK